MKNILGELWRHHKAKRLKRPKKKNRKPGVSRHCKCGTCRVCIRYSRLRARLDIWSGKDMNDDDLLSYEEEIARGGAKR